MVRMPTARSRPVGLDEQPDDLGAGHPTEWQSFVQHRDRCDDIKGGDVAEVDRYPPVEGREQPGEIDCRELESDALGDSSRIAPSVHGGIR